MATVPSSLIIFFIPGVGVEILQRAVGGTDAGQTHTSYSHPQPGTTRPRAWRHPTRVPACAPGCAVTGRPRGSDGPAWKVHRREIQIRKAAQPRRPPRPLFCPPPRGTPQEHLQEVRRGSPAHLWAQTRAGCGVRCPKAAFLGTTAKVAADPLAQRPKSRAQRGRK